MKPSPEQNVKLAEAHVDHYTHLLTAYAGVNVREDECREYLAIWRSIAKKKGENLTPAETTEVMHAVWSGDYDELLGIRPTDESATS